MGNLTKGHYRVADVIILSVLGSVASIAGLVLAVVWRMRDSKNHKVKESNRPA